MLGLQLFDPGALAGILGVVFLVITPVVGAWALRKTQGESRWRSAAEAADQGLAVCERRLQSANEWTKDTEMRNKTLEARYEEQNAKVAVLEETCAHLRDQASKLLEQTPEKLWEAVERHSAEAERHWEYEKQLLEEIRGMRATLDDKL